MATKEKKEYTVTYTVSVTEIIRGSGATEEFLVNDYPDITRDMIRSKMGFDDVSKPSDYKVFVRDRKGGADDD